MEDLQLLRPTTIVSPSQCFAGFNRDGTETHCIDQEDESASVPVGELFTYPADQSRQFQLASKIYASPRQSTILPIFVSRPYAQQDVAEDSIGEGSRISNPDMDTRYSEDHRCTIAFEKEVYDVAVALFDFTRESVDELPLNVGQIIWVCSHQSQGWVMAKDPRTGELGFVPENFVRLLPDVEGNWSTLSGGQPANKERPTNGNIPSNITGSCTNVSAEKRDTNGDVKEVKEMRVTVDTHQEVHKSRKQPRKRIQASAEPSQPFSRRTSITVDPVDSDQWGIIPMTMSSELCSSEITRKSDLSAKNETPSSQRKEIGRGKKLVVQRVARGSPLVEPTLPRTPVSMNGIPGVNHGNVSRIDLGPVPGETQRSPAKNLLRRRGERAGHEGQYDRTGETNTSEHEGFPSIVEYHDTNPGTDKKDGASTEKVSYRPEEASTEKERNYRQRKAKLLTAAALERLEKQHSSSKRSAESSIPKQKRRRSRGKDNIQDSGHGVPLLSNLTGERGGEAASISSTVPDPGLLDTVENAVRRKSDW